MKLLVVLFLIGYMNASQASTSSKKIETYSFEINDNTLCDIVLLNDKEYLIDLIYTFPEGRLSGHEEVNHTILSYGNYNTQNNVVIFKDAVSEYRLSAVRKESFIEIIEGVPFILNKRGDLSVGVDNYELLTESLEHYKNHVSTYQMVLQQKEKSSPIPMKASPVGKYTCGGFQLHIQATGTYEWFIFTSLVSQGTWQDDNGILECNDTFLKTTFYAIVKSNSSVQSLLFPGYYANMLLRKR